MPVWSIGICERERIDRDPSIVTENENRDESGDAQSLWAFTKAVYAAEGVAPAVLTLQDRYEADVNLLFYACYVALVQHRSLDPNDYRRADGALAHWRCRVTKPLRAVRECIKFDTALASLSGAGDVRARVLAAEIESERIAQTVLQRFSAGGSVRPMADQDEQLDAAVHNLRSYFDYLGVEMGTEDQRYPIRLLTRVFSDLDAETVQSAWERNE